MGQVRPAAGAGRHQRRRVVRAPEATLPAPSAPERRCSTRARRCRQRPGDRQQPLPPSTWTRSTCSVCSCPSSVRDLVAGASRRSAVLRLAHRTDLVGQQPVATRRPRCRGGKATGALTGPRSCFEGRSRRPTSGTGSLVEPDVARSPRRRGEAPPPAPTTAGAGGDQLTAATSISARGCESGRTISHVAQATVVKTPVGDQCGCRRRAPAGDRGPC